MNATSPVLVVDDSRTTVLVVSDLLRKCGFTDIDQAGSGTDGLSLLHRRRHRLVLCDVKMQGMSGIQVLTNARQDPMLYSTCFVLMTASRDREVIGDAIRHRADSIIMKPFTEAVLKCKLLDLRAALLPSLP